jgi:Calx-beta domain
VSVHYATSDGAATSPADYTATSGDLNWADGDAADKTFTVAIVDDTFSEGNEAFNLTLSAATGNADLGPQSTATVTIAKSDGTTITGTDKKPQSTFTDSDGDLVTVKLGGKVGTLTYYQTNGTGPISEIDLIGTDSSKSVVSVTAKKPKGGTGDGRVQIGEIDGTGAKSLSLAKTDLVGAGINLTTFLRSLMIGDIRNGADLTLAGAPPTKPKNLATKITAGVIDDRTDIAITGAPLGSLTATRIGVGTITAPSVGSINIKGKAKTKTTLAIPGDFKSNLTVAGAGLAAKVPALKSLKVAGSVSSSMIAVGGSAGTVGDVGSVSVGSFVNSRLFAGYSGPDDGTGSFNLPSTIGSFTVKGKSAAFSDSFVIASNFKNVSLASVDPNNNGTKFGFVYHTLLNALAVKSPAFKFDPNGPAEQDMLSSDFEVKKV